MLEIITLIKLSHLAGLNRVSAQSDIVTINQGIIPVSLYGLLFALSNSSKDKILSEFDINILEDIKKKYEFDSNFSDVTNEEIEPTNFTPPYEVGDATPEALFTLAKKMKEIQKGGIYVHMPEFASYILSENMSNTRSQFIAKIVEAYDGKLTIKLAKIDMEKNTQSYETINNLPITAFFHSSPTGLLEGKGNEKMRGMLNRGLARRMLLCFPDTEERKKDKYEDEIQQIEYEENIKNKAQIELLPKIKKHLLDCYNRTTNNNTFTFTREADIRLKIIRKRSERLAEQLEKEKGGEYEGVIAKIKNEHWETLKAATIIAFCNHPEDKNVHIEDVDQATKLIKKFQKYTQKFYDYDKKDEEKELKKYMIKKKNKWVTTLDIRSEKIVSINSFSAWFAKALPTAIDMIEEEGYIFLTEKHGRNGQKYMVTKPKTEESDRPITISQNNTNTTYDVLFRPVTTTFAELKKIIKQNKAYSLTTYENDHRANKNAKLEYDVIAFDVDEGQTIEEAKQNLNGYKALISTTKSHQKQKDKKPACDRFRVLIPLSQTWKPESVEDYRQRMKRLATILDLNADPSAIDASRFFYGNSEAENIENEGHSLDIRIATPLPAFTPVSGQDKGQSDNTGIINWFSKNHERYGGRNNTLYIAKQFFKNDKDLGKEEVRKSVLRVNSGFHEPLPITEIQKTIFQSL
jgi:hypothetical protein